MSSEPSDFSKQPQSPQQPAEQSASRDFCEPSAQDLILKAEESSRSAGSEVSNDTGGVGESKAANLLPPEAPPPTAPSAPAAPPAVSGSDPVSKSQATQDSLNQPRLDGASKDKLINTLGNPHASEADWINAAEQLGDSHTKPQQPTRKYWTVFFALLALCISILGYSVVSIISSSPPALRAADAPTPTPHPSPMPPPTVSPNADIDFGPYMADLQRRIKRAWFPPKGEESKRVVVVFKVLPDGNMNKLKLDKSSGARLADEAALRAVENAAPFQPLPVGATKDGVDIQFTFDYNVFNGAKNGSGRPSQ